ncbi:MAG: leucyl aminopeptidase family protein, partial [Hyphococcus sp.]
KDMGGAAHTLALAGMIMGADLPVRLRALVPAVENAVSGNAFRPGDILKSRKGLTVEIGNTDAEGRLILADALALAGEDDPELTISLATLTGAARVALGPDLAPYYCDDAGIVSAFEAAAEREKDPVWRMPLWKPYDAMLASSIADVNHISGGSFAGSVTAALFLRRFAPESGAWMHFDLYAWRPKAAPGRPVGGEAQAIRALFAMLQERYGR